MRAFADVNEQELHPVLVNLVELVQALQLAAKKIATKTPKHENNRFLSPVICKMNGPLIQGIGQGKIRSRSPKGNLLSEQKRSHPHRRKGDFGLVQGGSLPHQGVSIPGLFSANQIIDNPRSDDG